MLRAGLAAVSFLILSGPLFAQVDEMCRESGVGLPSLNSPFANIPYVFGRVELKGLGSNAKFPKVTVTLLDPQQTGKRLTIEKSGNYCFRKTSASGGSLVVEVDGVEVARRALPSFGPTQQREDFEIVASGNNRSAAPGIVSAKFSHPQNERTMELYRQAGEAEKVKDQKKLVETLRKIVEIDPADFIAWAKLGAVYFELNSLDDSQAAFKKSIETKVDYTPAWVNIGKVRVAKKEFESAIEIFKHAAELDPSSARTYQLLGQAYLQAKKGTLGAEALNKALELDPIGMAECHLLLAKLYDLAGAKNLASNEYRLFLSKVREHSDRSKFEKYIKDNPK